MNDTALSLWQEWFSESGDPWVNSDAGSEFGSYCFFCGGERPEHYDDCVFIKVENLLRTLKL